MNELTYRIHGLWHSHIVKKGQAGASVPKIAWQFIQTRVLIASLIFFLGMIIALCSPVIISLNKIFIIINYRQLIISLLILFPDTDIAKNNFCNS